MAAEGHDRRKLPADAAARMVKSWSRPHEFSTCAHRPGQPSLLDRILVDYYGAMTP